MHHENHCIPRYGGLDIPTLYCWNELASQLKELKPYAVSVIDSLLRSCYSLRPLERQTLFQHSLRQLSVFKLPPSITKDSTSELDLIIPVERPGEEGRWLIANGGVNAMDPETRLPSRLFSKRCDALQAGGFADGNIGLHSQDLVLYLEDGLLGSQRSALSIFQPWLGRKNTSWVGLIKIFLLASIAFIESSAAASVKFENCMSPNVINSLQLKLTPYFVNATFDSAAASHHLNVTVYGDVSGSIEVPLPPPGDQYWNNITETEGKIPDLDRTNNKYTTLKATLNVLNFTPYKNLTRFCDSLAQGVCPLVPSFTNR